jgi:GNAT superfamily N-acetyltransferase
MSDDRLYPEQPAGPFPEPPVSFEDREGREIETRGGEPGAAVPEALVGMYEAFDPADRAQGIPPSGERRIREWLAALYESGYNAVAWHGADAAGHATLVAESDDGGRVGTDHDDPDAGDYELAIFVRQGYQGAGIGKRLLRGLLGFGAAHGVERVWLTVERWNRPAVNLYQDVGFEVADSRTFEYEMGIRLD